MRACGAQSAWIAASLPVVFIPSKIGPLVAAKLNAARGRGAASIGVIDWLGIVLGTPLKGQAYREATSFACSSRPSTCRLALLLAAFQPNIAAHTAQAPRQGRWEESRSVQLRKPGLAAGHPVQCCVVCSLVTFTARNNHRPPDFLLLEQSYAQLSTGSESQATEAPQVMSIGQVAERSARWRFSASRPQAAPAGALHDGDWCVRPRGSLHRVRNHFPEVSTGHFGQPAARHLLRLLLWRPCTSSWTNSSPKDAAGQCRSGTVQPAHRQAIDVPLE